MSRVPTNVDMAAIEARVLASPLAPDMKRLAANNRALSTANRHLRAQVAHLRDIIVELRRQRDVWQARATHEERVRDRARSIAGGT